MSSKSWGLFKDYCISFQVSEPYPYAQEDDEDDSQLLGMAAGGGEWGPPPRHAKPKNQVFEQIEKGLYFSPSIVIYPCDF